MTSKEKDTGREQEETDIELEEVEEVREQFEEHNREVQHKQVEELATQLQQAQDELLRARAEMENIRRRAETDVANARKFAVEKFAAEVLLVRDSLESASQVDLDADNRSVLEKMQEGLQLTLKQLDNAMHKFDIEEVSPAPGERLDPDRHQAMGLVEAEGIDPNHIVSVMQKGYTIKGRLLRPAMVMVAK
jgi:molecular chaperone GrpE